MTAIMVAISFQYDTQTNAKDYSLALLEACTKSLAKVNFPLMIPYQRVPPAGVQALIVMAER